MRENYLYDIWGHHNQDCSASIHVSCLCSTFNHYVMCVYNYPMIIQCIQVFWKLCYQFFSLSTCYLEKLASNKVQHHHHPQARVAWLRPPPSYYFHVPTLSVDFHSADNLKTVGQKTLKNFQITFSFSPNFFCVAWRGGLSISISVGSECIP